MKALYNWDEIGHLSKIGYYDKNNVTKFPDDNHESDPEEIYNDIDNEEEFDKTEEVIKIDNIEM